MKNYRTIKHGAIICSLLLLIPLVGVAALSDYLILYYPFNSATATDQSFNGHNGTVSGATWVTGDGPSGGAMEFDGKDDYIKLNHVATLDSTEQNITMMALVKPFSFNDGEAHCPIINKWDDDILSVDRTWRFFIDGTTPNYEGTIFASWSNDGGASSYKTVRSSAKLKTNEWQHVTVVIKDSSTSIYINGELSEDSSTGNSSLFYTGERPIFVGAAEGAAGMMYYHGMIDEVMIYDIALKSGEIQNLAYGALGITNSTLTTAISTNEVTDEDLVLFFTFDEDDDTQVEDQSGNNLDGTVYGPTWTGTGLSGGAMIFDGTNDYIRVAHNRKLNFDDDDGFTVSFFVSPSELTQENVFIDKWDQLSPSRGDGWSFLRTISGTIRLALGDRGEIDIDADSELVANEWVHLCFSRDGNDWVIFKNGESIATGDSNKNIDSSNPLIVGSREGVQNFYSGAIDHLKIYNVPVSGSGAQQLYNELIGGGEDDEDEEDEEEEEEDEEEEEQAMSGGDDSSTPLFWGSGDLEAYHDFDGDKASDLCVFDDSDGSWYITSLSSGPIAWGETWGWPGAKPVPGDYDGDGIWDLGVYDEDTGGWYVYSLTNGVLVWGTAWGFPGAKPVAGDYDGDNKTDMAVYDEVSGSWFILSPNGNVINWGVAWGWEGLEPVSGDYTGDGMDDITVYDPSSGAWYVLSMSDGTTPVLGHEWGGEGLEPVPGDYNGDLLYDLALFNTSNGAWYIYSLTGHEILDGYAWGWPGAVPVAGDYDGDGWDDLAVYNNTTGYWYIISMNGTILLWDYPFGWPGKNPVSVNDR